MNFNTKRPKLEHCSFWIKKDKVSVSYSFPKVAYGFPIEILRDLVPLSQYIGIFSFKHKDLLLPFLLYDVKDTTTI